MNKIIVLSVLCALLIGGIIGFSIGSIKMHHGGGTYTAYERTDNDSQNTPRGKSAPGMNMMDHRMHGTMMVQSEQAFVEGMIPHHEEAVRTAKEVLARGGTTPEIRTLAQNIVNNQTSEIEAMKTWYQSWYNKPYAPTAAYQPMMRDLGGLSSSTLDKVFLEDMIRHHQGALMMTSGVDSYLEHEELRTLTKNITAGQTQEITEMQKLLSVIK